MRFGQAHGAGPFAGHQLAEVGGLLLGRAVRVQAFIGAVRQARIHGPGLIGRIHHLVQGVVDEHRQALATVLGVAGQRRPTGFDILPIGLLETLGRGHHAVLPLATLGVAALVQREDHFGAELAGFLEHLVDGLGIEIRMLGQILQFALDVEELVHHKLHVAQRRYVLSHYLLLK